MFASPQLTELAREKARILARSQAIRADVQLQMGQIARVISTVEKAMTLARHFLAIRILIR